MKQKLKDIITVVDIGTTKICTIIAEKKVNEKDEFYFQVKGFGITESEGMERGSVIEMNKATSSISKSIEIAQKSAQMNVANIYIGIAGAHIKSSNFEGNLNLATSTKDSQREITLEDIKLVIDDARRVAKYQPNFANLKIIHAIPHYFSTDTLKGISNPLGMEASRLSARVHIVFANETNINNIIRCFKISGYIVNPDNVVLEPIASSYAVLNKDQRDLGAILIDIGGGTTDIAVYYHNSIRFSAVFSHGGYELTRKLSDFLKAAPGTTEELKINFGQAIKDNIPDTEQIEVIDIAGKRTKIFKKDFAIRINDEMTILIHKIFSYLSNNIRLDQLKAGIYLTGGAANLKGLDILINQLTCMSCIICNPDLTLFKGQITPLEKPQFSTAIGIFLYVLDSEIKKGLNEISSNHQMDDFGKKVWIFIKNLFV